MNKRFDRFVDEDLDWLDEVDDADIEKYSPDQPRVLSGPQGGEWTRGTSTETDKLLTHRYVEDMTTNLQEANAGFLTTSGNYLDLTESGTTHEKVARQAGTTLDAVMREGTARIYSQGEFLGIEVNQRPTEAQIRTLSGLARVNSYSYFGIEGYKPEGGVPHNLVTPTIIRSTVNAAFPDGGALRKSDDGDKIDELFAKFNPYHVEHGPEGGQFTSGFGTVSPSEFVAARDKSSRINYLSPIKPDDLSGYKLFASRDRTVGVAVSPTGDINNVFNNDGPKGAGAKAVKVAIANGGVTLDCYAGFLPMYYSKLGFEETSRVKFDPQYAPPKWNYAEQNSPDVVYMRLKA